MIIKYFNNECFVTFIAEYSYCFIHAILLLSPIFSTNCDLSLSSELVGRSYAVIDNIGKLVGIVARLIFVENNLRLCAVIFHICVQKFLVWSVNKNGVIKTKVH